MKPDRWQRVKEIFQAALAEPKFDPIRSDPRFQNILKRIGFKA